MAPPTPASNLRAFVRWKEPTVYAGEDIECIITFKNIARRPGREKEEAASSAVVVNGATHSRRTSNAPTAAQSRRSSIAKSKITPGPSRTPSIAGGQGGSAIRGHRPALSLNVVNASSTIPGATSAPIQDSTPTNGVEKPGKGHLRSVSIMSLGSEPAIEGKAASSVQGKRYVKPHVRSASLSHTPKLASQSPAMLSMPSPRQPSPLYEATTPPLQPEGRQPKPLRPPRRRTGTVSADHTPQLGRNPSLKKKNNVADDTFNSFKFPLVNTNDKSSSVSTNPGKLVRNPSTMHSSGKRSFSPRPPEHGAGGLGNLNPLTRVLSETSNDGTPRTSSEFYSMSNHSDETLTSELPLQQHFGRLFSKMPHSRQPSRSPQDLRMEPETLMMGYVQTIGQFTLDGSLVNAAPFEDVKRKGIQGGGGVIGIEQSKRSSGLFGAFGWGNIGESLGGLLGSDETSSMAQMKAIVGSKSIPLLSTPQSLLFIDLKLEPGESRSYHYRFPLPKGLPPTHRGRAIKVSYHLSLGVQRPEGQAVKRVQIPFRVLGSYDVRGKLVGHDLMSPYIQLQDAAETKSIIPDLSFPKEMAQFRERQDHKSSKTPRQGLEDFLRYTERLKESSSHANGVLLSPTSPASPQSSQQLDSRQNSMTDSVPSNAREAIDLAILRANVSNNAEQSQSQSANRFNISRAGDPVGVLTILRPSYRLGEAVTGTIDFTAPDTKSKLRQISTYSVLVELESAEQVDASLALRSSHSINRVTRKVHAFKRENCLFARQVGFGLVIPSFATPSFETTGVMLTWRLRIEFTTQRQVQGLGVQGNGGEDDLIEELATDERGTSFIAKERLAADTFEIAVPLTVYGSAGPDAASSISGPLFV